MSKIMSKRGAIAAPWVAGAAILFTCLNAHAGPLAEAWRLLPGDRTYLTSTGDTQRGLAYSATTDHVYVASRATGGNGIFILNAATGADVGSLDMSGVTGGTFAFNTLGAGSDGAIYAANLTTNTTTSVFKIYRWANETSSPTVVYSGNPLGATAGRFGDALDVTGSGTNTLLLAGRGTATDPSGLALFRTTDGATFTAVASAPTSTGNYRQGVTFGAAGELYGKEAGDSLRRGTFDATLAYTETNAYATANFPSGVSAIDVDNGRRYLAALAPNSPNAFTVSLWDVSDTANPPVLVDTFNPSGTPVANGNAAGQIAIDPAHGRIYVLDTNNGVAALSYPVPEPTAATLLLVVALPALATRRRRSRA